MAFLKLSTLFQSYPHLVSMANKYVLTGSKLLTKEN